MERQQNNTIVCKYCNSTAVVKYGKYKNVQRYWCKSCHRKLKADDALFHMKKSLQCVSSALSMYYNGMSIANIGNYLQREYGYHPSKSVVYDWIDKYTTMAIEHFRNCKPQVGDTWIIDETILDTDGRKIYFWDIIDIKTRFLLASRASLYHTSEDAQKLMESALKRASKAPKVIVTNKLSSCPGSIELNFSAATEHSQSSPFVFKENTALVELFRGALKERIKVMRGFKDFDTLIEFAESFLVFYNFLKPHEALGGRTPADVAQINYKVRNWADINRISISSKRTRFTKQ
jgi:transposase-like protein